MLLKYGIFQTGIKNGVQCSVFEPDKRKKILLKVEGSNPGHSKTFIIYIFFHIVNAWTITTLCRTYDPLESQTSIFSVQEVCGNWRMFYPYTSRVEAFVEAFVEALVCSPPRNKDCRAEIAQQRLPKAKIAQQRLPSSNSKNGSPADWSRFQEGNEEIDVGGLFKLL